MYNKTENGTIKKYKYLKVIDSEELNSDPEMTSTILALLYEIKYNYLKNPNNDYGIVWIENPYSALPNKKGGVSEAVTSDTPMRRAFGKNGSTILLAYNKNIENKSYFDKLKNLLHKSTISL